MHKFLVVLFFSFFIALLVGAQEMPAEGSKLSYRIIGFKIPPVPDAGDYKIEIASCNCYNEDSFKNNIIITESGEKNKIIGEVPSFGAPYTWRCMYTVKGVANHTPLFHFSTKSGSITDTNVWRLRIMQPAEEHKDDYVFLDGNRGLYDMKGNLVWYLPYNRVFADTTNSVLLDLKLSNHNTITFLYFNQAYEANYNGEILWKAPNSEKVRGDFIEHYHHEFTRLENGHYMVLGTERNWQFPSAKDSLYNDNSGKSGYVPVDFGTVIEYDEKGNVVWLWKSSKYFLEDDPNFIKPFKRSFKLASFDFVRPTMDLLQHDVHENAFYFDEKNKMIYVSFKNMSRIVKVKYPEGNVLTTYGPVQTPGGDETGINSFCHQHSCRLSQDGYLYLFNNNLCTNDPPKIMMYQEPANAHETLKKIWEYQCTMDGSAATKFISGGNVLELPDHSFFVSMGSGYNKVFIVSPDKKVLWSALPEKMSAATKNWDNIHQYRSSIISREQLEKLIWNSEKQ